MYSLLKISLRPAHVELIVRESEYAGHAIEIARTEPLEGVSVMAIIGGDGSFHELVNGIHQREDGKRVPLGLIPGGSGNCVMADLGTWDPIVAARRIVDGECCWMDVIRVRDTKGFLD